MVKPLPKTCEVTVEANGTKIVQPIYWGSGGCVGGNVGIKRSK